MQCHNLPSVSITTLGFRNLLIHPTDYDIISLVKVLHTTHVPSNVSLGISLSPAIYSPQCPLTKSYQYLSRFLLFNTIHDYLDKLKLTTLSQGSIYSRASTICPCTIIHLTNKHTPPYMNYVLSSGGKSHTERTTRHTLFLRATCL